MNCKFRDAKMAWEFILHQKVVFPVVYNQNKEGFRLASMWSLAFDHETNGSFKGVVIQSKQTICSKQGREEIISDQFWQPSPKIPCCVLSFWHK